MSDRIISYFGGKVRAASWYPAPTHATIVEPFAGGAGYSYRYYDRNIVLIEKYDVLANMLAWFVRSGAEDIPRMPLLEPGQRVSDLPNLIPEQRAFIGFWIDMGTERPKDKPTPWSERDRQANRLNTWTPRNRDKLAEFAGRVKH
jgi:hypothetical protein